MKISYHRSASFAAVTKTLRGGQPGMRMIGIEEGVCLRACEKMGTGSAALCVRPGESRQREVPVPIFSQALHEVRQVELPRTWDPTHWRLGRAPVAHPPGPGDFFLPHGAL